METVTIVVLAGWMLTTFGFLALLAVLATSAESERQRMHEQMQSLAVLGRAESLEQFASVEHKLTKDRLEAAREEAPHAADFAGEVGPVPGKPRRVLDSVWRRRPNPAPLVKE